MICFRTIPRNVSNIIPKSWFRHTSNLKVILNNKIPQKREIVKAFRKSHGQMRTGETTVAHMYDGMRDLKGLICETSVVDPKHGIRFHGLSLEDCIQKLPKSEGGSEPVPEGMFWFLLTGDIPNEKQVLYVSQEWAKRSELPAQTREVLHVLKKIHPMGQLSAAVISMSDGSKFRKAHRDKVQKETYWEFIYEDAMDLLGKLIVIAAIIYNNSYHNGAKTLPNPDPNRDWTYNFAKMLGFDTPDYMEMLRLYLTIHSDHEGGNVSAHTVHLVGSALSDPYLSYSAGVNGLAGPHHGLANEEVLIWLNELLLKFGDKYTERDLGEYIWTTLRNGQMIPGFGHPVLQETDPRYLVMRNFAKKHRPDDKVFKLVSALYKTVPPILLEVTKKRNSWPNAFAHSGALLQQYGMPEITYHTVMFSVSRAMGVLAQLVWSRALYLPAERPKSFSTEYLMKEFHLR